MPGARSAALSARIWRTWALFLFSLATMTGVDLQAQVEAKTEKNAARAYRRLPNGVLVKDAGTWDGITRQNCRCRVSGNDRRGIREKCERGMEGIGASADAVDGRHYPLAGPPAGHVPRKHLDTASPVCLYGSQAFRRLRLSATPSRSAWDRLTALADPSNEGLELGNGLWLGVQRSFQLVHLVRREPQEPVLGKHRPGPLHRRPQDEGRKVLLLHAGGRPDRLKGLGVQPQVNTCGLGIGHDWCTSSRA